MQIIYRNQLPGKAPKTTVVQGWVAAIVGALILIGIFVVLLLLLPIVLIGVLGFLAFILFLILAGWLYLGYRIGYRNMWDITRLLFGFGSGSPSWDEKRKRVMREWEEHRKGKPGQWTK
jgi:hypothetical protein